MASPASLAQCEREYREPAEPANRTNTGLQESAIQQEHLVESAKDAARLSEVRFKTETTDYLEVLTNETNAFSAELGLVQTQANELIALVQMYQLLGADNDRLTLKKSSTI